MPHNLNLTGIKNFVAPVISTGPSGATSTPARSPRTRQGPPELQERAPRQANPEQSRTAPRTDLSEKLKVFAQLNRDDLASKNHVGPAPTEQEGQASASLQPPPTTMPPRTRPAPTVKLPPEERSASVAKQHLPEVLQARAKEESPIPDDAAQIAGAQAAAAAAAAAENMINQANREAKVATMGLKAAKDIIG